MLSAKQTHCAISIAKNCIDDLTLQCQRVYLRYEGDLPKQGRSLDCALFLCRYATDLLRQGPVKSETGKMQQFREAMLKTLESIGDLLFCLLFASINLMHKKLLHVYETLRHFWPENNYLSPRIDQPYSRGVLLRCSCAGMPRPEKHRALCLSMGQAQATLPQEMLWLLYALQM